MKPLLVCALLAAGGAGTEWFASEYPVPKVPTLAALTGNTTFSGITVRVTDTSSSERWSQGVSVQGYINVTPGNPPKGPGWAWMHDGWIRQPFYVSLEPTGRERPCVKGRHFCEAVPITSSRPSFIETGVDYEMEFSSSFGPIRGMAPVWVHQNKP
jgi:hypothetical protein